MIKFKDINYPRRKEKEIIINLPNEIWKDVCDGYKVSNYGLVAKALKVLYGKSKTCGGYEWIKR